MTKKKKPDSLSSGPPSPGLLSSGDEALWDHVTQDVKPMKARPKKTPPKTPASLKSAPRRPRAKALTPEVAPLAPGPIPGSAPGSGLDGRTQTRLRRGQMAIEARLDLHGMTQAQAHEALDNFLARAQDQGKRCVLVVTGKGGKAAEDPDNMFAERRTGVLRAAVPRWLGEGGNRARVLSFDTAQPRHGGEGALYVLLRRRR